MFLCRECQEQYEDKDLAYSLILECRVSHPAADAFVLRFCSKAHVQEFLRVSSGQQQKYVLTKIEKGSEKVLATDSPLELLLLIGSSKAS